MEVVSRSISYSIFSFLLEIQLWAFLKTLQIFQHWRLFSAGGTFALYSLLCRYAKVGLIPSQEAEDRDVSTFHLELPNNRLRGASRLKSMLESSRFAKLFLLFATMLGTSMFIGDGVLTPCISGDYDYMTYFAYCSFTILANLLTSRLIYKSFLSKDVFG